MEWFQLEIQMVIFPLLLLLLKNPSPHIGLQCLLNIFIFSYPVSVLPDEF